jgi:hypothetical protein
VFANSSNNYINTLSKIDHREVKYFGINLALSQSSNIVGNLISTVLIKPLGQFYTILSMAIISFSAAVCFLFFKDPIEMGSMYNKSA